MTARACSTWTPGKGGAWPWCDACGWRADLHPDDPPVAATVRRIVEGNGYEFTNAPAVTS